MWFTYGPITNLTVKPIKHKPKYLVCSISYSIFRILGFNLLFAFYNIALFTLQFFLATLSYFMWDENSVQLSLLQNKFLGDSPNPAPLIAEIM